jgi:hypothetical protein
MKGGGQPLTRSVRDFFEPRFCHDFSGVRVHTGSQAAEATRSVNARAFTLGKNVVFGAGQYSPGTTGTKKLLGHELAHVVQQSRNQDAVIDNRVFRAPQSGTKRGSEKVPDLKSRELIQPKLKISSPNSKYENEADRLAEHVVRSSNHDSIRTKTPCGRGKGGSAINALLKNRTIGHQPTVVQLKPELSEDPSVRRINHIVQVELDSWFPNYKILLAALGSARRIGGVQQLVADLRARPHKEHKTYFEAFLQLLLSKGSERILELVIEDLERDGVVVHEVVEEMGFYAYTKGRLAAKISEALQRIGTRDIIKNLLGGVAGVVEGLADIIYEMGEGIWSFRVALDHLQATILYFLTGAAQEAGLRFLKRLPILGYFFDPATYKVRYEATIEFFRGAKEALKDPGKILQGIKAAASSAWDEVLREYNAADDFNKSRIIARSIFKVGIAVGGIIKSLPGLVKGTVKITKTLGKTIAKALKGVFRLGGKIIRGTWRVVKETIQGGKTRLRYFFRSTNRKQIEVAAEKARQFVKCSKCDLTPNAKKSLRELERKGILEEDISVPPERQPVKVGPSPRGFALESHLNDLGYDSLPHPWKGIDGIKGGKMTYVKRGGKTIKVHKGGDGISVKSTEITNPSRLKRKVTKDLDDIKGRYVHEEQNIRVENLKKKRLHLIFDEGKVNDISKETLQVLKELKKTAGNIDFKWFVMSGGQKYEGVSFFTTITKTITNL